MKPWILLVIGIFVFSGCSTKLQNNRLRSTNAKQAALIQQQRTEINTLRAKLNMRIIAKSKAEALARKKRKNAAIQKSRIAAAQGKIPTAPKKNIKLKKVEDSNYSSTYMYPGAKKKSAAPKQIVKSAITTPNSASAVTPSKPNVSIGMTKAECISMIGANKFAKYTQMFGSESASLKRCKMLKAMKQ